MFQAVRSIFACIDSMHWFFIFGTFNCEVHCKVQEEPSLRYEKGSLIMFNSKISFVTACALYNFKGQKFKRSEFLVKMGPLTGPSLYQVWEIWKIYNSQDKGKFDSIC